LNIANCSRKLENKKDKILFFTSFIFFIIALNLIFDYILPIEDLKYMFLLNVLLSVFYYFIMFGKLWHPIFLFIGTLTLFQGGLIINSMFDNDIDLSYVFLMSANIFLKEDTVRLTILLISLSYWFALIGAYFGSRDKIKIKNLKEAKNYDYNFLKQLFLVILFIAMPFYIYKHFIYFSYFLQYGYIGFYKSTEFLEEAGFLVRSFSFLVPIAFLGYFFLEKNKKLILLICLIYFIINIPPLLSGFRGQFFTFWLTIFLFYKQKFNNKLSFKALFILIFVISTAGLLISFVRDDVSPNVEIILNIIINKNPILEFFKQQGASFYVTAMAIEFKKEFAPNILKYLMWEPIGSIFPTTLSVPGRAFATDLMIKINYNGYLMGYGTGSSYLAEAYLLGGSMAVCLTSFFIGYFLSKLYKIIEYTNIYIKILIFTIIQYAFFLPRDLLLMPLAQAIKVSFYLLLLFFIIGFIKQTIIYSKKLEVKP
jgi:oligosaccharide repeat unit polymerase